MQQRMEMLQGLSITGIHVMCVMYVLFVLHLMLFALDVIILANAFSLPFFIEIYTFVIQVIALHTELYPLEKQIM